MIAQHIVLRGCGNCERLLWTISQRASFGLPQNIVQCVHVLFLDSVVVILNHPLNNINTFIACYGCDVSEHCFYGNVSIVRYTEMV